MSAGTEQNFAVSSLSEISEDTYGNRLTRLLDDWFLRLRSESPEQVGEDAVRALVAGLAELRVGLSHEEWFGRVCPMCRHHKIAELLREDPYTARALEKPRGFAGDAKLLDLIYDGVPPVNTGRLGRALFAATASSSSGLSVVDRRDRLTNAIRQTGQSHPGARVLAIACGHLREAERLTREDRASISAIDALDQDARALETVGNGDHAGLVSVLHGSVRDMIAGRISLHRYDLAYAAGLFDYLSDFVAVRLLRKMLEVLTPGGRLLVGNFTPGNWGRPYMDTFMDWRLEYRTPADMRQLGREASSNIAIRTERVYADSRENIAYLELTKA